MTVEAALAFGGNLGDPVLAFAAALQGLRRHPAVALGRITGREVPAERLAASIAAHLYGASRGAAIIRAHDVAPHIDALKTWAAIEDSMKADL